MSGAAMGWGLALGCLLGIGLWSFAALMPRLSRLPLHERVAPYLVDLSEEARVIAARRREHPVPVLGALLAPLVESSTRLVGTIAGDGATIERWQRQAADSAGVDAFRARQLLWGVGGAVLGVALVVVNPALTAPPAVIALPVGGAVVGFLARAQLLRRAARARLVRIESELPSVLEFLTLSLAAGESVQGAITRLTEAGSGDLSAEFRLVRTSVSLGVPLTAALQAMAADLALVPVTRGVDQMVIAIERGTPLADVLRAQAQDARQASTRLLLEQAGRKEVTMLVPLVFLILPLTICFALFPGVAVLQQQF